MSQNLMSISALNIKIKSLLEATFMHIMVEGEVASVTYHNSGHIYFSIKDDTSTIRCVMWRSSVAKLKFRIEKGEHIIIEGSIGVYTPRGEYQFIATHVEPYGKGALALAFEQLKAKLKAKGYFEKAHKKSFPVYPQRIAIVTARNSAALQDMLKVATKRWAAVEITIIDVLVQGEYAAAEIGKGIAYADQLGTDMIIVGRGGGSSEDLWAFNEECVADAIYAASTPVVSAVGHEVDILISDFVADLRAPTPSAAMEMVLPDVNELRLMMDEREAQFSRRVSHVLSVSGDRVQSLSEELSRLSLSNRLILVQKQFDALFRDFSTTMQYRLKQFEQQIEPVFSAMHQGMQLIVQGKERELHGYINRLVSFNPKQQMREAWAQINQNGTKICLEDIAIGEEFDLVSERMKMRVKSLKKEALGRD